MQIVTCGQWVEIITNMSKQERQRQLQMEKRAAKAIKQRYGSKLRGDPFYRLVRAHSVAAIAFCKKPSEETKQQYLATSEAMNEFLVRMAQQEIESGATTH